MRMVDIDEFKRHTKNLALRARSDNDTRSEEFFNRVVSYVDQYVEVFEKGNH